MAQQEDPRLALAKQRAAASPQTPEQLQQQFKDTWGELKKTTWPDRPTLMKSTYIVLAFIALTAIWVGLIDFTLTHVAKILFTK